MKLLIGSRALKISSDKYLTPNVKRVFDWDWIGSYSEYESFKETLVKPKTIPVSKKCISLITGTGIHEFEIAWTDSCGQELLELVKNDESIAFKHDNYYVGTPDLIFALKKSHRYLKNSPHFLKTMLDYRHLESMGCKVPESLAQWYKKREQETYNYSHPKLKNISKKDFFKDDMVPYKYDHDTLHLAVMHLDQPAYNYFKPNTSEVQCSKQMFDACQEQTKLYSVLEESYVLALERSQIPTDFKVPPKISFDIALSKVCTSITSGWYRAWAYNHYFDVQNMYNENYVHRFKTALENGTIKPFNKNWIYPHAS